MTDVLRLLLRLKICTNCYRHLRYHCPRCWACNVEKHRCDGERR